MTMLGAQLGELLELKNQLATTNTEIGAVSNDSVQATESVIDSVEAATSQALRAINLAMDNLNAAVGQSMSKAAGTNWTGSNQARFLDAYGEFQGAMNQAEASTNQTFAAFDASIKNMTAELASYKASLTNALMGAQSSVSSMEVAVQGQHDNLDAVMNQGLSVS